MTCKLCKKPVWKFTNKRALCGSCFMKYFEKKVKATIRKYNMPIHAVKAKDLKSKIINNILKELPERKGRISLDNLNTLSNNILYIMMYRDSKELKKIFPVNQPLYFLSDEEILLYAKIKKINNKFREKTKIKEIKKIKNIDGFIKIIEKKNPDIRHNIVNALLNSPYI